jgi:hypothetical protein
MATKSRRAKPSAARQKRTSMRRGIQRGGVQVTNLPRCHGWKTQGRTSCFTAEAFQRAAVVIAVSRITRLLFSVRLFADATIMITKVAAKVVGSPYFLESSGLGAEPDLKQYIPHRKGASNSDSPSPPIQHEAHTTRSHSPPTDPNRQGRKTYLFPAQTYMVPAKT